MTLVNESEQHQPDFKSNNDLLLRPTNNSGDSSAPLEDLPPSFEESTAAAADVFSGPYSAAPNPPFQEPPPQFTPYFGSFFTQSDGSIVSHDAHLNEDGKWQKYLHQRRHLISYTRRGALSFPLITIANTSRLPPPYSWNTWRSPKTTQAWKT